MRFNEMIVGISSVSYKASFSTIGGALKSLQFEGEDIVPSIRAGFLPEFGEGQVLAPFANRIRGGMYDFDGETWHLPLNEPEFRNAIHGFARWNIFEITNASKELVEMETLLGPQPGYPFMAKLQIRYCLNNDGLEVWMQFINLSNVAAPVVLGFHPYFLSEKGLQHAKLKLKAKEFAISNSEKIPVSYVSTYSSEFNFSSPKSLGDLKIDNCFRGLNEGVATLWLERDQKIIKCQTEMLSDIQYLMVYTADDLGSNARKMVALEPMTGAPNAFNSGDGLTILDPGKCLEMGFRINCEIG